MEDAGVGDRVLSSLDEGELVQLTRGLQAFKSYPGYERECVEFLGRWLRERGLEVELPEAEEGRPDVVGRIRGTGGGASLMLNGHLDIDPVPMNYPGDPWACYEQDGRLYGHGIMNMKGGVAALSAAAAAVKRAGLPLKGDLVVAGVVGELQGGVGTYDLVQRGMVTDYAIICEPSYMEIRTVHSTVVQMLVHTIGESTWIGRTHMDSHVNAVEKMCKVVERLRSFRPTVTPRPDLPGLPRSLVGGIIGGLTRDYIHWRSPMVPDFCTITFEVRSLPDHRPEDILREVRQVLDALMADDPDLKIEMEPAPATYREPWRGKKYLQPGIDVPVQDPIVQAVRRNHIGVVGEEPASVGAQEPGSYAWTDGGHLFQAGCRPIIYGPARNGDTYVELDKLVDCAKVLALSAVEVCNWDK